MTSLRREHEGKLAPQDGVVGQVSRKLTLRESGPGTRQERHDTGRVEGLVDVGETVLVGGEIDPSNEEGSRACVTRGRLTSRGAR